MSSEHHPPIPEEKAREIWRRAVELQMEAARERQRLTEGAPDDADAEGGLSLEAVRAAAVEAGISEEYVRMALAEQEGALEDGRQLTGWADRMATRLLKSDVRVLEVAETVPAPPRRVLAGLQEVAPRRPYRLELRDTLGDDPLNGGILVFRAPGMLWSGATTFTTAMSTMGIRDLRLSMIPVDDGAATRVRIVSSLARPRKTNWLAISAVSGIVGVATGGISLAIAAASGAALPVAMGAMGGSVLAGTWGSSAGFGAIYRKSLQTAEEELRGLIRSVKVACRLGPGFLPRGEDDDDSDPGLDLLGGLSVFS